MDRLRTMRPGLVTTAAFLGAAVLAYEALQGALALVIIVLVVLAAAIVGVPLLRRGAARRRRQRPPAQAEPTGPDTSTPALDPTRRREL